LRVIFDVPFRETMFRRASVSGRRPIACLPPKPFHDARTAGHESI
jgi:hypothetical protein